ncbi:MAG: M15 family metallopeptidase [Alphaproteobacteria bacterium]|nr:M15 family metallopeptidase [Alphaproteobacteria bacterium]
MLLWMLACTSEPPAVVVPDEEADADADPDVPEPEPEPDPEPQFCRNVPNDAEGACWHSFGGLYADGACSESYQCCDGAFGALGSCGECACTEPTGHEGCVPAEAGTEVCFAPYTHTVEPLPTALRDAMAGTTYEEGCPVGLDALALITTAHWGFDGEPKTGQLVVKADLASVYVDVLQHAWQVQFPIERIEPASAYGGSDDASMAVNNTSAFNCRPVTGGTSWSQHSYGHAIDVNPRQNPYVSASGNTVLPPEGAPYVTRDPSVPGLIVDPGPVVGAFRRHGWGWGGSWNSLKDYQHFSENGL